MEDLEEVDTDLETQQILLAAAQHDLPALRQLLRTGSANVQDPETGVTPLHAAIAACEDIYDIYQNANGQIVRGHAIDGLENGVSEHKENLDLETAIETVRLLLQNGAIWNDLDKNNETPGCVAKRLRVKEVYDIMVDAGVRAEMLLNRLDEYEALDDEDEAMDEDGAKQDVHQSTIEATALSITIESSTSALALEDITTEIISTSTTEINNADFLRSGLSILNDRILDSSANGVMMSWETSIMERTADLLVPHPDLKILNIGHGMGIIDTIFQSKSPSTHHIIEAHPAILANMRREGWYDKSGVKIWEGKWREILPTITAEGAEYDAIYFDTFAENYKDLRYFFSESLFTLLSSDGKWGFFNGLGADRQICYDVYGKVVEMDLFEAGFDVEWETIRVPDLEKAEEWKGVRRRYWALGEYRLPICRWMG